MKMDQLNMTGDKYPFDVHSSRHTYKNVDHSKIYNKIINRENNMELFRSKLIRTCSIIDLTKVKPYPDRRNGYFNSETYEVEYYGNNLNDFDKFNECINNIHKPDTITRLTFTDRKFLGSFNIFQCFYEKSNIYIVTNPDKTSTLKYTDEYGCGPDI